MGEAVQRLARARVRVPDDNVLPREGCEDRAVGGDLFLHSGCVVAVQEAEFRPQKSNALGTGVGRFDRVRTRANVCQQRHPETVRHGVVPAESGQCGSLGGPRLGSQPQVFTGLSGDGA